MRKTVATLKKGLYLLLTEMIAVYLIAFPVHAFQVSSSSTGYVRVATASAISAYQVAQRAAFTSAVASAISAPTAASVAVRLATGPVGGGCSGCRPPSRWRACTTPAQDVQAVKTAAIAAAPPIAGHKVTAVAPRCQPGPSGIRPPACIPAPSTRNSTSMWTRWASPRPVVIRAMCGTFTDPAWPGWTRSNQAISGPTCRRNWIHNERWDGSLQSAGDRVSCLPPV